MMMTLKPLMKGIPKIASYIDSYLIKYYVTCACYFQKL